jgi:carboxyl-terminal processing protease
MPRLTKLTVLCVLASIFILSTSVGCSLIPGITSSSQKLTTVDEAWDVISRNYVDKSKVDSTKLSRAAVKGMVDALNDPYTTYLDPEAYRLNITNQQGSFGGIGATVGVRDSQIIVVAPIPGTPAEKAGIKAGDAILAVNGESTEGLSIEEVVLRIRGQEGTAVTVTIKHQGETQPEDLIIVRAEIDVPSVVSEMRSSIAYVQIHFFSARTDVELTPVLSGLVKAGATGIILDLRSNPGGPVDTVVDIASHFVDRGFVLYIVDNAGHETSYPVKSTAVKTALPVVLLTDNFSASGSEVLSGFFQDTKRGVVAGTQTFGKGSADQWYQLSDGSAIYLTTSRWLTPNRRLIEGKGITPDFSLDLKGDDLVNWAVDYLSTNRSP